MVFLVFWFWVVIAGLKGVTASAARIGRWLCTPWGNNDDLFPTLRGSVGQTWSADEYRQLASLDAKSPVPTIPDVMQGMEQALNQEKRTAKQLGQDIAEWQRVIQELNAAVESWTEKAATAFAAGRNDLARAAIAERQRTQQRIRELESDVQEMRRLLTSHASDIQDLQAKLGETYRRNHLAETRLQAAETSARARQMLYGEDVKDALTRFEEMERAADLAEGQADALALGSPAPADEASLDAQLAALPKIGAKTGSKRAAS